MKRNLTEKASGACSILLSPTYLKGSQTDDRLPSIDTLYEIRNYGTVPPRESCQFGWFRPLSDLESLKDKANHSFHSRKGLQPILSNGIVADGLLQDPTEPQQAIALDSGHQRQVHLADSLA